MQKLSESLGVSLAKFISRCFTSAGDTTYRSYIYAFNIDQPDKREKKSKQSIFWQLGEELKDDLGHCSYYNARLTLNGSFFDCSPEFDLNEFLIDVAEVGEFNVTQADMRRCQDKGRKKEKVSRLSPLYRVACCVRFGYTLAVLYDTPAKCVFYTCTTIVLTCEIW